MTWADTILETLVATLGDVLPIALALFGFQFFVLRRPIANLRRVLFGFLFVLLGLTLFLVGLDRALFPIGRLMATQLTTPEFLRGNLPEVALAWTNYYWILIFAFLIGFATTLAEPALIAVALKAGEVSGGAIHPISLRLAVAIGVALGITVGVFRIITGLPIQWFIVTAYIIVVLQTWCAPRIIIPLAFDSGGVATSTVTVPIIAALGLGLAEAVPGRNPLTDGFGLIAFACLFPIMTVMAYAQIAEYLAKRLKRNGQPDK
ncbi:MAG: DUF1538 domain-containing protein [Nitrosomonas sp.]|nr:DUF1538 domain-containing protein [Nitrosomonas sp.]